MRGFQAIEYGAILVQLDKFQSLVVEDLECHDVCI